MLLMINAITVKYLCCPGDFDVKLNDRPEIKLQIHFSWLGLFRLMHQLIILVYMFRGVDVTVIYRFCNMFSYMLSDGL